MERKSAIKRRATNDTATDDKGAQPMAAVRCKHCGRGLANISEEGRLDFSIAYEQACASCEPLSGLYEMLRTREQEHTSFVNRGPKHHGRFRAHEQLLKARVELENFLASVQASSEVSLDVAQAESANLMEPASFERTQEPEGQSKHVNGQIVMDDVSLPVDRLSPTTASPSIKRKLARDSGASALERKRIKFGEDVTERPEYRGSLEYYRGAKEYVPGRYAVTDGSEYENTSGSTISFARFTGQRKVGSRFVDIVPKEETPGGEERTSAIKSGGKSGHMENLAFTGKPDTSENGAVELSSRALRLSRRTRSTPPPASVRPHSIDTQLDGQEDEPPKGTNNFSTMVAVLKCPNLSETNALNGDLSVPDLEDTGGHERVPRGADLDKAVLETTQPVIIAEVISNIQRELRTLQQTTVTMAYRGMILEAVRGCYKALGPLQDLDFDRSLQVDEAQCSPEEEDSVYFEASDGAGGPIVLDAPGPPFSPDETVPKWSGAIIHNGNSSNPSVSQALDVSTHDYMPRDDVQNLSEVSDLGKSENDNEINACLHAFPIEQASQSD